MAKARRAKKSKISKKLLIVPLMLVGVGAGALGIKAIPETTNIPAIVGSEVKTYEVNDFFKDAFTQNETKYLPIVYTHPYIAEEHITKTDIENELKKSGLTVKSFSSDTIKTGTRVETTNGYTYTVLIYGDVNSDGLVNVLDALDIIEQLLLNEGEGLTGINRIAANVDNEKTNRIDVNDVLRIVDFIVGEKPIIDTLPTSDIANDKEAPVIELKGEKTVTIKVGEDYIDPGLEGLKITDNLDPNIESKLVIDTSRVITDIPGDYIVTYDVTDASGNKAKQVTRVVRVVDYITDIEYEWTNNEFGDGDEIKLDGMKAYAVYKYAGKTKTQVDVKLADSSPKYAIYNETGKMTITINYEDFEKEVEILVSENRPIITLEGPEKDKIKVFSDKYQNNVYVDPGATVKDKVDTNLVPVTEIRNSNNEVISEIRTDKPGTYTITYTVVNSNNKEAIPKVRTVEVLDYIEDVVFRLDTSKFKTEYVDGESISKEGVKAYAIWKYASYTQSGQIGQIEITDTLDCDTEIVRYDRNHPSNNTNRKIVFSYTVNDVVEEGISKTYTSEKHITPQINVIKKLETIVKETVQGTSDEGDRYDYLWVARVKSGDNEEKISADKIACIVKDADSDKDGFKTRVWAEEAYEKDVNGNYVLDSNNNRIPKDGYVDIYFVGVGEDKIYEIELTPITDSEYKQTTKINVRSKINTEVNHIEIGELEDKNGNPIKRFKSGETVYAKLTFYHRYGKENEAGFHDDEIANVPASSLGEVFVDNDNAIKINKITGAFLDKDDNPLTSGTSAYVKRISLTAAKDTTDVEKDARIMVTTRDGQNAYIKRIKLYPESKYTLDIGKTGITNVEEPITLSLKALTLSEYSDYEVRDIGGNYYTLLPIALHDQWENQKIYYSDLSTDYTEKDNGKIVIYDHIDIKGEKSYIDIVGIDKDGNPVRDVNSKLPLEYIGIAIKDAESGVNEEDSLEGNTITIFFENKECKRLTPITIKRQAVSSIQYKDGLREASAECYEDTKITTVVSGPRQEAITNKNVIECEVKKQIKNSAGIKTGLEDVDPSKYEITTVMEVSGEVTIRFSAEDAGTYEVTPMLRINSSTLVPISVADGQRRYVQVEITENREVNKVVFINDLGNPQTEGNYGGAAISVKERNKIEYYHQYKDEGGKVIATKKVENVNHDLISITTNIPGDKDYSTMISVDKINNNSVIPEGATGLTSAYIEEIRVIVNDNSTIKKGDIAKFRITMYKDNTKQEVTYEKDIIVVIEEKPEITHLRVGWEDGTLEEDINIYVTEEGLKDKKVVKYNDAYYTKVPIRFFSGNKELVVQDLNMSNIKANIGLMNQKGMISFIDNVNDEYFGEDGNYSYIDIQGFVEGSDIPVSKTDKGTVVDYIGIAVLEDNQVFLNAKDPDNPDATDWVQLKEIKIYYDQFGATANLPSIYTLNIKTPDLNKVQTKMRNLSKKVEPIKINEEDIKYVKQIDPNE